MRTPDMIPEIWSLVFQCLPSRNDLRNVCSVCRSFDAIATPLLYRSLIFRDPSSGGNHWSKFPDDEDVETQDEADDLSFGLFCRLLDDRNDILRGFVREVIFDENHHMRPLDRVWRKFQPPNDVLAVLVDKLPNLEVIHFHDNLPITDALVNALISHKKSPKVHLLKENGRTRVNTTMPFVQKLHTSVDARARAPREPPGRENPQASTWEPQRLALGELVSAFPNLEDLSVSVNWLRGGCVMGGWPSPTRIEDIVLPEGASFPRLRSLSLSGYPDCGDEVALWRDEFSWDSLHTLSLGVQLQLATLRLLEAATGKVVNLKEFQITDHEPLNLLEITEYDDPIDPVAVVDAFLRSFDTLETLTAKGAVPSFSAVLHQSNLKHLCLHAIEEPERDRVSLDANQIKDLDKHCPELISLEIDLDLNGTWPDDIVTAIATGFKNLRQLSIHVGLGIAYAENNLRHDAMWEAFAKVLTKSTAADFAKRFFELRGPSSLKKITLSSGEDLRWFPQWHPGYANAEEECAKTYEICAPLGDNHEPRVNEVRSYHARMRELEESIFMRFSSQDPKPQRLSRSPRVFTGV